MAAGVRPTRVRQFLTVLVVASASHALGACGTDQTHEGSAMPSASSEPTGVHSKPTTGTSATATESLDPSQRFLCDPGFGSPEPRVSCPSVKPQTGWVTATQGGLRLTPFTTLHNDATGRRYAEKHGEEFPFPNDYFDAPSGGSRVLDFHQGITCTGVILVGYREPLEDHVVPCDSLRTVAQSHRVPVAVWANDDGMAQISELYRP